MNTKTIIWDIDGVLIWHHPDDPNCDWRRALADNNLLGVWEAFQHSPEWELCIRNHEIDTRERFNHFLQNKGIALRHDIDDVIHIWLEKNIEPSLPALNRLYELREKGAECVVASNQDALRKPHIEHWLTRYGLDDLPCFISCDLKAAKPDPLFYVQVQESLGKQPEDLVLLDDKEKNFEAAENAGWQGILIDDSFRRDPAKWDMLSFFNESPDGRNGTFRRSMLLAG